VQKCVKKGSGRFFMVSSCWEFKEAFTNWFETQCPSKPFFWPIGIESIVPFEKRKKGRLEN